MDVLAHEHFTSDFLERWDWQASSINVQLHAIAASDDAVDVLAHKHFTSDFLERWNWQASSVNLQLHAIAASDDAVDVLWTCWPTSISLVISWRDGTGRHQV